MKKEIPVPKAPQPIAPYSQAIKIHELVFVSGQIPIDPQSGQFKMDTIEEATKQVLDNIVAILKKLKLTLKDVVKCQIYLTDMNDFEAMNIVYAQYFADALPTRECVQVSRLPKDVNIEISCIAVKRKPTLIKDVYETQIERI